MNNSYVKLPANVYFPGPSLSLMAWVNVQVFVSESRFVDCGNGPLADNVFYALTISNTTKPYFTIFNNATNVGYADATTTTPTNTWFHVAVTYDDSTIVMYQNGIVIRTGASGPPRSVVRNQCYIGRSDWNPNNLADAYFDEIAFYNRALSQTEVIYNMNQATY